MTNKIYFPLLITVLMLVAIKPEGKEKLTLWDVYDQYIKPNKFIDLTHAFFPGIPSWKGYPNEKRVTLFWYKPGIGKLGSGFFAESYEHVGQWGTHVDPPAHFIKGLRTVDEIPVKEMVMPLVIIDVHKKVEKNPDYQITMEDLKEWEKKNGYIPQGSFVAMRTDWSKRWPNQNEMQNKDRDGTSHYPGWSIEVLKYLFERRIVTAIGHEPTDTDPGVAASKDDYSLESYVLSTNHYQIELLVNLDQVPQAGALVVVSFPKPRGGSGFPARVFAILP